jgi:hypothetical protein
MAQRRQQRLSKEELRIIGAYKFVFGSDEGKIVLEDLKATYYRQPFGPNRRLTDFRCGGYDVVDRIVHLLEEKWPKV